MSEEKSDKTFWKEWALKHKGALFIMIIAGVCAFIGVILVGIWVLEANPSWGTRCFIFLCRRIYLVEQITGRRKTGNEGER